MTRVTRGRWDIRWRPGWLLMLALAALALTPVAARAATVTGTFTYDKTLPSGSTTPRPIAFARVEIWHRGIFFWNTWQPVGNATTDSNGFMSFTDGRCDGTYGVRVFATNYAAVVWPNDVVHTVPFHREPGEPGPVVNLSVFSCNGSVDFSSNFADSFAPQHYNIAEAVRKAFDYANARRDPRETDVIPPASVQPTGLTSSWFNPSVNTVVINSSDVNNDLVIIHEYAHFLEANISTFAWIPFPVPGTHDGCFARDAFNLINSAEQAWMEGFAEYFAQAVARFTPGLVQVQGAGGTSSTATLEAFPVPACGAIGMTSTVGVVTPNMVEDRVAAVLWDLFDAPGDPSFASLETADTLQRRDVAIFQIFDREMSRLGRWPTITDFQCAWVRRGLPAAALDRIATNVGITVPSCPTLNADRVIWRPSTGDWWVIDGETGAIRIRQWGTPGDIPVPGDYDRDGWDDFAVWRPSTGEWFVIKSSTGTSISQQWGLNGDVPVPGDYDGDGKTDFAVWRPSTGQWFVIKSSTGLSTVQQWGVNGDVPVPGDYDRDGKTDYAVWRPSNGTWYVINSSGTPATIQQWGLNGDVPVPGDYDRDGRTDFAVWRRSTGQWFVINSSTGATTVQQWGLSGDTPVPGDYDRDGRTDFAVWRPSTGEWFVINSSTGAAAVQQWGLTNDVPIKAVLRHLGGGSTPSAPASSTTDPSTPDESPDAGDPLICVKQPLRCP